MSAPEIQRIVTETLAFIQHHRLSPGDRLPSERDLAERMTVGRGVVREALAALETVRLVERRAKAGFFVRDPVGTGSLDAMVMLVDFGIPLSQRQVRDAVEMRRILEVQAVALACARRTPEDIARLQSVLQESEARLKEGRSIAPQDAAFHQAIVLATHNDVFSRMVDTFHLLSRARREKYFADPRKGQRSHRQHKQIVRAVERGDAQGGVSLLEQHLQGVETYWMRTVSAGEEMR